MKPKLQSLPDLGAKAGRAATSSEGSRRPDEFDLEMAGLCKALGHPVRVAIIRYLMDLDECVTGSIVARFSLAQSTISQHLKILKQAGLIQGTVEGTRVCYCLEPETFKRFKVLCRELLGIEF